MTTLYVDHRGIKLKYDSGAIAVYDKEERVGTVPLGAVDRVVLHGDIELNTSLLNRLGERGIGITMVSKFHKQVSCFLPKYHNDARIRISQYKASENQIFCLEFVKFLISDKIRHQSSNLSVIEQNSYPCTLAFTQNKETVLNTLLKVQQADSLDSLRGMEGAAAKSYFACIAEYMPASINFRGRNRRPPRDPLNVLFSLSYTLMHSEAVSRVYLRGLDPFIGFFHSIEFGRESLACDLIEPLRPMADSFAIDLFKNYRLRPEHFSCDENSCSLGKAGRAIFYKEYEEFAKQMRTALKLYIGELINRLKIRFSDAPSEDGTIANDSDTEDYLCAVM